MKLDPQPVVISNLGTSYFYLHRYADAVKQFEKAVELNPKRRNDDGQPGRWLSRGRADG